MKTPWPTWAIESAVEKNNHQVNRAPNSQYFAPHRPQGTRHVPRPIPRHEACLTKRAMLAALREAELAAWQNSGGDYWVPQTR